MITDIAALEGQTVEMLSTLMVPVDFSNMWDPISQIFERGDRLTLTATNIDASILADGHGVSLWTLLDDEDAQIKRWGNPMFRRATEASVERFDGPSHPEYIRLYREEQRAIRALPAGLEKRARLLAFGKRFPVAPSDNQETMRYLR